MSFESRASALIRQFRTEKHISARALLVTIFGDSIEPRGGSVWLGDLIALMAPLHVSERLVRTSIQRLVSEGVLVGRRVGRRSYYSVTEPSRHDFRHAEERIYHRCRRPWEGDWTLILMSSDRVTPEVRGALRQRLGWLGFGPLTANVYASPVDHLASVGELLEDLGVGGEVIVLSSRRIQGLGLGDEDIARLCCNVDEVQSAYRSFLNRYEPLAREAAGNRVSPAITPELAFCVRTLLVHDFRRIVLRDPQLPPELLPSPWDGEAAYETAGTIYRSVRKAADTYVTASCGVAGGPKPPVDDHYLSRFEDAAPELGEQPHGSLQRGQQTALGVVVEAHLG